MEDLKYWDGELQKKIAELSDETDALVAYRNRVARAIESNDDVLHINSQCLLNRFSFSSII